MQSKSSIRDLINSKCLELNISYKELIIKSKYSNVSVGLKRLNQLFNHDYQASAGLIEKLPLALNISLTDIKQAIICSKIEQKTEQDITERLLFKPNVLVRTEQSGKPKQIYIAAILNANQYITQELPDALAISEYKNYAMNFYHLNIERIKAFFYAPIDIVINYSFEYSEVISLTSNHIEYLNKHERAGELTYEI